MKRRSRTMKTRESREIMTARNATRWNRIKTRLWLHHPTLASTLDSRFSRPLTVLSLRRFAPLLPTCHRPHFHRVRLLLCSLCSACDFCPGSVPLCPPASNQAAHEEQLAKMKDELEQKNSGEHTHTHTLTPLSTTHTRRQHCHPHLLLSISFCSSSSNAIQGFLMSSPNCSLTYLLHFSLFHFCESLRVFSLPSRSFSPLSQSRSPHEYRLLVTPSPVIVSISHHPHPLISSSFNPSSSSLFLIPPISFTFLACATRLRSSSPRPPELRIQAAVQLERDALSKQYSELVASRKEEEARMNQKLAEVRAHREKHAHTDMIRRAHREMLDTHTHTQPNHSYYRRKKRKHAEPNVLLKLHCREDCSSTSFVPSVTHSFSLFSSLSYSPVPFLPAPHACIECLYVGIECF